MGREPNMVPLRANEFLADCSSANSTNPNPLLRMVNLSVINLILTTDPQDEKN
jgi:hypothetical protein